MKNMGAKSSVEAIETPREFTLTPSGNISYGYIFTGDVTITKDQLATLKELPASARRAALKKME